jgi:hypothetical protein
MDPNDEALIKAMAQQLAQQQEAMQAQQLSTGLTF